MAGLDRAAIHALASAGLSAVVHVCRDRRGRRRVQGVHVIDRIDTGLRVLPAVEFGDTVKVYAEAERLADLGVRTG